SGNVFRRMHLERQLLLRIENFDEQRETRRVGNVSEDCLSVLRPQFVQSFSAQRPVSYDALRFGTIDNFPRFTDTLLRWKLFAKFRFWPSPAPDSLHKNWLKGEGVHEVFWRHARRKRPTLNAYRPTLSFRKPEWVCYWTFGVQCWMFGVSVLISDFRRLTSG